MDETDKMSSTVPKTSCCSSVCSWLWRALVFIGYLLLILLALWFGLFSFFGLLPDSYIVEKTFLGFFLMYALIFLVLFIWLVYKAKNLEKKQSRKPNLRYLGMRLRFSKYIDSLTESGVSRIQEISEFLSLETAYNMEGYHQEENQNLAKLEEMLKKMKADIFEDFGSKDEIEMMKKCVFFELKKRTVKHPGDLQGRRRCNILFELLSNLLDDSDSCFPSFDCPNLGILASFSKCINFLSSILPTFGEVSSPRKYPIKSVLKTVSIISVFTLAPFLADTITDIKVVTLYWDLWSSAGNTSMINIITDNPYNVGLGTEIFFPAVYLSVFLTISLILAILTNPVKKLVRQFKVQMRMNSPDVEKNGEILSISSLAQRHDLPIEESGLESPLQSIFQFSLFLSLVPLVHVIKEIHPENPILAAYDEKLKFVDNFLFSGITSVYSLTMGQVKRSFVFSEQNTSWAQTILYFVASLFATISFLLLFITTVQAPLESMAILGTGAGVGGGDFYLIETALLVPATFLLLGAGPFITRLTRSKNDRDKLLASRFSWLTATFTSFMVPPSQLVTRGRYNIYNNPLLQSPQLLLRAAEQCGSYFLVIIISVFLNHIDFWVWSIMNVPSSKLTNSTITDFQPHPIFNRTHLSPQSSISPARKNVLVSSVVLIPVGLILSYVCLFAYYRLNNGFTNAVNMDYIFNNNVEGKDDSTKEGVRENIHLLVDAGQDDSVQEDTVEDDSRGQVQTETIESNNKNWLDAWIDRDVEEDCFSMASILKRTCGREAKSNKWNTEGYWLDLTGDDGLAGYCRDGAAVLNGEKGSLEDSIKRSFPYYRNGNQSKPLTCCSCWCCFCVCENKDMVMPLIAVTEGDTVEVSTRLGNVEKGLEDLKVAVENMACKEARSVVAPTINIPGSAASISGVGHGLLSNDNSLTYSSVAGGGRKPEGAWQNFSPSIVPTQNRFKLLEEPQRSDRSRSTSKNRKIEDERVNDVQKAASEKPARQNRPLKCGTGGSGRAGAGKMVASFEMFVGRTHPDTTESGIRELVIENNIGDTDGDGVKLENVECISELKDDNGESL